MLGFILFGLLLVRFVSLVFNFLIFWFFVWIKVCLEVGSCFMWVLGVYGYFNIFIMFFLVFVFIWEYWLVNLRVFRVLL